MNNKDKRPRRKPGKTLLISNEYNEEVNYEGIVSTHSTNSGSRFIVFDNVDNSRNAYNDLRPKGTRVKVLNEGINPEYSCNNSKFVEEFGKFNFTEITESIKKLYYWYKNESGLIFDSKIFDDWKKTNLGKVEK